MQLATIGFYADVHPDIRINSLDTRAIINELAGLETGWAGSRYIERVPGHRV